MVDAVQVAVTTTLNPAVDEPGVLLPWILSSRADLAPRTKQNPYVMWTSQT